MTVKTLSGAVLSIGPAVTDETNTEAEYAALTPYVDVGEAEDMGEVGDESPLVNFADIGAARIRKLKGARDAGTMQLVCGKDPLDAGQQALKAAERTKFEYAFRLVLEDAPTPDYSDTIFYWRALVTSQRDRLGTNDNVVRTVFTLAINSEVLEIPAEEITV